MRCYDKQLKCGCIISTKSNLMISCYSESRGDEELKELHKLCMKEYFGEGGTP